MKSWTFVSNHNISWHHRRYLNIFDWLDSIRKCAQLRHPVVWSKRFIWVTRMRPSSSWRRLSPWRSSGGQSVIVMLRRCVRMVFYHVSITFCLSLFTSSHLGALFIVILWTVKGSFNGGHKRVLKCIYFHKNVVLNKGWSCIQRRSPKEKILQCAMSAANADNGVLGTGELPGVQPHAQAFANDTSSYIFLYISFYIYISSSHATYTP